MDVLSSLSTPLVLVSLLASVVSWAAPPDDLVLQKDSNAQRQKERGLTEDDLVYTDIAEPLPDARKELGTCLGNVAGRSLPTRDGKSLFRMSKGEKVKVLRPSKDGHWLAVYSLRERRKAWVPLPSIELPPGAPALQNKK